MDHVPAVVVKDVQAEEQSIVMNVSQSTVMDVSPSTTVDVTSTNSDAPPPPEEETAGSEHPASRQELGIYSCQDCGEAFGEEAAYLDHRQQHPDGKCTMYLEPMDDSDIADEDEESTNACQLCTLSFDDLNEFQSHMETHHAQGSDTQKDSGPTNKSLLQCSECGKSYSILGHYLNHQRTHIQASKSLFDDLDQLKKKSFQCETCGRNYSRASALDAHRRGHEEKLFKRQNRNSRHKTDAVESAAKIIKKKTSANSEKLFKCSCGRSFAGLMHLKTHQRFSQSCSTFSTERTGKLKKNLFTCKKCRKTFHGHLAWFNHEKWHENHSEDSPNRFPCEACGKVFMTQTFYYRHQRMVHSESPEKSFLYQVYQLQKKAFECTDCGLKFSRPSALQSHQLQHTGAFTEAEKIVQVQSPLETIEGEQKATQRLGHNIPPENVPLDVESEDHLNANEPEEEGMESYEPGDFNVLVISASESEDETVQDLNPNLDSGSVSDQEGQDNVSVMNLISKPELDLKIVQVDFGPPKEQGLPATAAAENTETKEPFACPDCYRCFGSEASLRAHLVWHNIRERRRQTQAKQSKVTQNRGPTTLDDTDTPGEGKKNEQHIDVDGTPKSGRDLQMSPDGPDVTDSSLTGDSTKSPYRCLTCGKAYLYLLPFEKHQEGHKKKPASPKTQIIKSVRTYDCPVCGKVFSRETCLRGHLLTHVQREMHKCVQCNKTFDTVSAWYTHNESHRLRPFWCLSCTRGFAKEDYLSRHLQKHHLGKYKCYICSKRFLTSLLLSKHLSSMHASSQLDNVATSQKKAALGSGDEDVTEDGSLLTASEKEEQEPQPCVEKEGGLQKSGRLEKTAELFKNKEFAQSNCYNSGELVHKLAKSSTCPAGEEVRKEAQTTQELDRGEDLEQNQDSEHPKYWEFECYECGQGFDYISQLHLHYVKHALGEVPFPDTEG